MTQSKREVHVIGAGPAGLMAAERLAQAGLSVVVHERMPSVARKFLMAGRGGLNLTHSEPLDRFLTRYGSAQAPVARWIDAFTPADLTAWVEGLG
ncbi:MAG: NAD(P)/FAD-dependent oxidoreductase, partial [Phenylobacterium sp.]|nr:NAD(P)/FAD-dependent oxidoreductase [Phenylobacterium sp.]